MSDPELNVADQHLNKALDELARLVDAPVQKFVSLKSSPVPADNGESETLLPQPLLEPIPIEVPLPPTPIVVRPPLNAALATTPADGFTQQDGLFVELSALSAATMADETYPAATGVGQERNRPYRIAFSPGLFALVVLVIFIAGMLTERMVRVLEVPRRSTAKLKEAANVQVVDSEFTGRITYKTKQGESQPDRGARVLIFPEQRLGEIKLSVVGFRPADVASDQLVANAALKALGGGAATANEAGNFRLPIEAGSYRLLILSHFQPRDDSVNDPMLSKVLSEYFDKPDELLGRVRYQFSTVRIKGTGDVWDHSF